MNNIYNDFKDVSINDKSSIFNTDFIEYLELQNLLENAMVTMHSANYRKESRGQYSHDDYPKRDDEKWLHHTLCYLYDDKIKIKKRNVVMKTLNEKVNTIPLGNRVY